MREYDFDRLLGELIEQPNERERILSDAAVSQSTAEELLALASTADAVWLSGQGAPPIEQDPVAALLGLVPDSACRLDSAKLSSARKQAKLDVGSLAKRLRELGWDFKQTDVFRWETRTAADVPPAVVQTISKILGAPVDRLVTPAAEDQDHVFSAVRASPRFGGLVDRWAAARGIARAVAEGMLQQRILATVHRGAAPDADQVLDSLESLIETIESGKQD